MQSISAVEQWVSKEHALSEGTSEGRNRLPGVYIIAAAEQRAAPALLEVPASGRQ